jgi:hypothetical protein
VLSGEATNTNFILFDLTRSRLEPTIYCTRGEHAHQYTIDAYISAAHCYLSEVALQTSNKTCRKKLTWSSSHLYVTWCCQPSMRFSNGRLQLFILRFPCVMHRGFSIFLTYLIILSLCNSVNKITGHWNFPNNVFMYERNKRKIFCQYGNINWWWHHSQLIEWINIYQQSNTL